MKPMHVFRIILACLFFVFALQAAGAKALIQVCILLDTSNSMDGLIEQAKTQLWKIVNELALSRKNGESPDLEVALYEYGNNNISPNQDYIRLVVPLTTDLDKISEELFKLTTFGGDEYCGSVIQKAARELAWSKDAGVYKVIFIAGNEEFTQGSVDFHKSCKEAISKGIIINTVFCGPLEEGANTGWKSGADLADGTYANIDQNLVEVYIEAPQDAEIAKLGEALNDTYIPFGSEGESLKKRQQAQDANAKTANEEAYIQRNMAKANKQYTNSGWDLVDAVTNEQIDVEKIDKKDLPPSMQNMSVQERKAYVLAMREKRENIRSQINKLSEERKTFIARKMKDNSGNNMLQNAILNALHTQALKKGFKF